MIIKRDIYLNKLIDYAWDGQIKVISGLRRSGKSFLLHTLYMNYLLKQGVKQDHIISVELDKMRDIKYRNPMELTSYVHSIVENKQDQFYLFIDEIQMSDEIVNPYNPKGRNITFYDALNDLKSMQNLDIYVSGSNSHMLSSDILTEFRGRSDDIRMHPLSFSEYYAAAGGDKEDAFDQYSFYGGMPMVLPQPDDTAKMDYLRKLFDEVYLKDIIERKRIERPEILSAIVDFLCSSIGSLTNPNSIANAINSMQNLTKGNHVSVNTVSSYLDHLEDAFLFLIDHLMS